VLRARRNANAIPTGVHAPLAANAAPAGVYAPVKPRQRPRCENDGSCYRQNPAHWADFHHANQNAPVDKPVQGATNAAAAGVHAPLTADTAAAGVHAAPRRPALDF
jgi:hypothetical protein